VIETPENMNQTILRAGYDNSLGKSLSKSKRMLRRRKLREKPDSGMSESQSRSKNYTRSLSCSLSGEYYQSWSWTAWEGKGNKNEN